MSPSYPTTGRPSRFPLLRAHAEMTPAERRRAAREVLALRDRLRAERLRDERRARGEGRSSPGWGDVETVVATVHAEHRIDPASPGPRCTCGEALGVDLPIERHVGERSVLALIERGLVLPGRERRRG